MLSWSLAYVVSAGFAQTVEQSQRVEIAVEGKDTWDVVPLGQDGFLLAGREGGSDTVTLRGFDTQFRPTWTGEFEGERGSRIVETSVGEGTFWLVSAKPKAETFELVGFDRASGERTERTVQAPGRLFDLEGLVVDGDRAWVVGLFDKLRTGDLLEIDLATGVARPLGVSAALAEPKHLYVERISEADGNFALGLVQLDKGRRHLSLVPFGPAGLGPPVAIEPPAGAEVNLLTAVRAPEDAQRGIVVGTYANDPRGRASQGLFLARYDGQRVEGMKLHSFSSFDHFFDYLPEKKRARLLAAAERKAEQGGDLDLNYLLLPHLPIRIGDRTLLVAEAYYPQYHTYTTTQTSTVNGQTTTTRTTHTVFDGYRYTHAVVAAFDAAGERLWDASMPIGNVLSRTVRPLVSVLPGEAEVTLLYASAGKVYSVVADASGLRGEKGEQTAEVEEGSEVRTGWGTQSAYWRDDTFLVWGFERVKGDAGKRTVFSFSALRPPAPSPAEAPPAPPAPTPPTP